MTEPSDVERAKERLRDIQATLGAGPPHITGSVFAEMAANLTIVLSDHDRLTRQVKEQAGVIERGLHAKCDNCDRLTLELREAYERAAQQVATSAIEASKATMAVDGWWVPALQSDIRALAAPKQAESSHPWYDSTIDKDYMESVVEAARAGKLAITKQAEQPDHECLCESQCPTCGYYCTCGNKEFCPVHRPAHRRAEEKR